MESDPVVFASEALTIIPLGKRAGVGFPDYIFRKKKKNLSISSLGSDVQYIYFVSYMGSTLPSSLPP